MRTVLFTSLFALIVGAVPLLPGLDSQGKGFAIEASLSSSAFGHVQVYYDYGKGFSEKDSSLLPLIKSATPHLYRLILPPGSYRALRFDPIDRDGTVTIDDARIVDPAGRLVRNLALSEFKPLNQIQSLSEKAGRLEVVVTPGGNDPQLLLTFDPPLALKTSWQDVARAWLVRACGVFVVLITLCGLKRTVFRKWDWTTAAGWLNTTIRSSLSARLLLLAGLFCVILGAKFNLIGHYGSDLPYWDQWDAEADFLLHPYLEGTLTADRLVARNAEHRILFTRLLTLGLFEANDRQWDDRVEPACNAILHAGIALLLAWFALRVLPWRAAGAYLVVTALFFGAAVSSDNTLVGFQSQFYFLILFSMLHIGGTLLARPRSLVWYLAPLAGAAALFSMASGLLSAAAILGVSGVRVLRDRKLTRDDLWIFPVNLTLLAWGWLLKTNLPEHADYLAPSFWAGVNAWLYQLAWPVTTHWVAALGILPPLALVAAFLHRKADGPITLALLGGCAWYWLQAAAIAYSRGAFNHGYESRYTDILSIGVLLNLLVLAYLACFAPPTRARGQEIVVTLGFAVVIVWGLARDNNAVYESDLDMRPDINAERIASVRDYTLSHDPAFFHKIPWYELPYPKADRLAQLLDVPVLRAILPPSVRSPVEIEADRASSEEITAYPKNGPAAVPPFGLRAWMATGTGNASDSAHFTSLPFVIDHSRVAIFVAGSAANSQVQLRMIDEEGVVHEPLDRNFSPGSRWKQVNFVVPKGRGRFEAILSGSGWLAFTQPFTNTALSRFAQKAVGYGSVLIIFGCVLGLIALVCPPRLQ